LHVRKKLKIGDNPLDSFVLNYIMPLDAGSYRLQLKLEYYVDGRKFYISSDNIEFELKRLYPMF
jgi:hypothetical protein